MNSKITFAMGLALMSVAPLAVSGEVATTPSNAQMRQEVNNFLNNVFEHTDTEKDGKISYQEARNALPHITAADFERADKDRDGHLNRSEFISLLPKEFADDPFGWMDTDKNGKLSATEVRKAFPKISDADFAGFDANRSGFLDRSEFRTYGESMKKSNTIFSIKF